MNRKAEKYWLGHLTHTILKLSFSMNFLTVCFDLPQNVRNHPKISYLQKRFSQQKSRVNFQVFQSNSAFSWLNSTVRCLVWENEQKSWEMLTSSLRSHNLKCDHFLCDFLTVCLIHLTMYEITKNISISRQKIPGLFLRFFSLTQVLLDSILQLDV